MARGKSKKGSPQFSTEFVRCELSSEEKKHFITWSKSSAPLLDTLIVEILQSNHKISFSFSEHNDSFICSVTGKAEDCDNANKCYTSHGKDYSTALWVALYKFHIVWQKGLWEQADSEGDFG